MGKTVAGRIGNKISIMKRAAMLAVALAVMLTAVFPAIPVKAAADDMEIVSSYTMAKGEKWTLYVYNEPDNAKVSYKSSKSAVAAVDQEGVVTAKKNGNAVITVTVKVGKSKYQAKTKIKVKSKISDAERVIRSNPEFRVLYDSCYNLAKINGWLKDKEMVQCLNDCYDIYELSNKIKKNPSAYSEEDTKAVLDAMVKTAKTMDQLLPVLSQPKESQKTSKD